MSVILSLVLLAYATTTIISFPTQTLNVQLPGFLFTVRINFITIVAVIVAVLMAAGADWLISGHPHLNEEPPWHHWIIPGFTAVAIGIPLGSIPVSASWWVIFALGGSLLTGVLVAEYIVVDQSDRHHPLAALMLIGVSFALFLLIVVSILASGGRLYILLVAILPTVFLISARTLFLRLGGIWKLNWALAIALIITQLAAGLYYLQLKPLQISLFLLAVLYALLALATNLEEKQPTAILWFEPTIMFAIFLILGFVL